ncbi:hypothetical protein [Leptolyngbya sp. FACHB-261]|uniref:hypothetical protein n=1 Tax=Leptolyngbya sp. FACHB-261 TaxID=2692806 RepID=UPI001688E8E2|nr:hypothetical protein [Leptolyngbya sp. FACHB-261]MBD2100777.1 hypothetical protein [Leptolyngbya sp. FACHB-261]
MRQLSFNLPEEIVLQQAKAKLDIARDLLSDLATLGMTEQWFDQFEALIQAYERLPIDDRLLSQQKALTIHKDSALKQAIDWSSLLRDRCKFAFGNTPHNPFPTSDFRASLRSEAKLLQILPNLVAIASSYAELLKTLGQPHDYAAQGLALRERLDQLNCQQEQAKRQRKIATENRRQAISAVYERLTYLNTIGRAVYRNRPDQRDLFKNPSRRPAAAAKPKV